MRIPVRNKLIFTYLMISVFTASLIYILTYFTSEQRIQVLAQEHQLKEMSQEITHWYAAEHQWQGFSEYFMSLHPPKAKDQIAGSNNKSKKHGLVDDKYRALLRFKDYQPGEVIAEAYLANAVPIYYQEQIIAWIIPPEATGLSLNSEVQVFLDNIREVLILAIIVGVLISLLMGMLLAKVLLKPVDQLTKAAANIANGKLHQQVAIYSNDEIGDLSRAFNQMSQDLTNADLQRRQLTADISHDLGTPVQVLSGYIEMAQQGTLTLNDQRLDTISQELEHIKLLVKDLSLLAKTDAKTLTLQLAECDVERLLRRVISLYQQTCENKKIQLSMQCTTELPHIQLDEERTLQVLSNLISNAIRYTPAHGSITIHGAYKHQQLFISVRDNGCGIDAQDLPLIFNRFYRADNTRSGESGKMGLGLSISQGLVEMQGGKLYAESDGKSGSCFTLTFPISS